MKFSWGQGMAATRWLPQPRNARCAHFAYLRCVDGKWEFAQLTDEELQMVIGVKQDDDEIPKNVKNKAGPLTFACFACVGRCMHDDPKYYCKNKEDQDKPNNQFKKAGLKTFGSNKSVEKFQARQSIAKVARATFAMLCLA